MANQKTIKAIGSISGGLDSFLASKLLVDLGVDVKTSKFIEAIKANPGCTVGLSALLTTTMTNMEKTVKEIKEQFPDIKIIVGGAPLSADAASQMGADGYGPNHQGAVAFLDTLA